MTKKNIIVSIALFLKEISTESFKVWVQVRLEGGPSIGLLEFPGGKIEAGETPENAARREVLEEVDFSIPDTSPLILFKIQDYSHDTANICLFVFLSNIDQLPKDKGQWLEVNYAQKSGPLKGKIPPINHVILDELAVYLQAQQMAGMIDFLWQI